MKFFKQKLTVLLLLFAILITLCACGGEKEEFLFSGTVYVPEFVTFDMSDLGIEYINTGCCDGTYIYLLAEGNHEVQGVNPETGENESRFEYRSSVYRVSLDGGEAVELENFETMQPTEKKVDRETYSYLEGLSVDTDGTLWVTESIEEYIYDIPENFDPDMDFLWNYEMVDHKRTKVRRQLDSTGREISRVDTGGLEQALGVDEMQGYVGSSIMDNQGNTYVFVEMQNGEVYETKIVVLNQKLQTLFEICEQNLWGTMILLGDGSVAVSSYVYDQLTGTGGQVLRTIDLEKQTWGDEYPMPSNVGNVYTGSDKHLFYYDNGDSLYGYDAEKLAGEKILTWSASNINRDQLSFFTFLEDGRIAAMTRSWGDNGMEAEIALLTEQDASVLADQTTLTYATMYLNYDVRERIIDFNKSQNKYRIEIRDYSEFNTAEDYNAGLTKLNTEIIAGQVPDILDTNGLPAHQYGGKGLLEDLWPYIENDTELGGRDGVMQEVLQAVEQDGKLHQIFNSFTIRTAVGASEVVGEDMQWTLEDLQTALSSMPEGCTIFGDGDTRESMLSNVFAMQLENFVDWNTGECTFHSEDFLSLLEFCTDFPLKFDWQSVDMDEYEDETTRLAAKKQMLSIATLYDFQYIQIQQYLFGGDITYVGYPREDGGVGSAFVVENGLAMSTTCRDKEGAWQFMREMLLPQSSEDDERFYFDGWGFPVNRQDFDRMAQQYMTPQYLLDEYGEPILDKNGDPIEQSQGGIGWGDGTMVELYATTQEQYDQIMELYHSIDMVYTYDETIYSIVRDVARRYFNDDLTAEEAVDQIQSRVKIYVNENL
ncbi:MAG: hypothetical protein IKC03_01605 [Oscillospiraceae bacterium]|nr:hypothetical protein [Oscillospiraceae bacterium]